MLKTSPYFLLNLAARSRVNSTCCCWSLPTGTMDVLYNSMSAKTDSLNKVHFDEENQPGISNLMSILSKITNESFESIETRYEGKGYGEFKREVANVVANLLAEIQTKFAFYNNREVLNNILSKGAQQAKIVASETLNNVKKSMGLN